LEDNNEEPETPSKKRRGRKQKAVVSDQSEDQNVVDGIKDDKIDTVLFGSEFQDFEEV
jgi:hypothetical protein